MSNPLKKSIPFTKASACGNDFLIIESIHAPVDIAGLTQKICERNGGVGADGVEWISTSNAGDVKAQLINSDGSEAEISGNGTRCVAAYWINMHGGENVKVQTGAGVKECKLISQQSERFEFEMNMGKPVVGENVDLGLPADLGKGVMVSLGNPHFVVFVQGFDFPWQQAGAEIQARKDVFPQGTNVEFAKVNGRHEVESRFFERGVGETQSSGTGSCASAVAAIATGRAESPVSVVAYGGTQRVRWETEIFLQGPSQLICQGEFFV